MEEPYQGLLPARLREHMHDDQNDFGHDGKTQTRAVEILPSRKSVVAENLPTEATPDDSRWQSVACHTV